MTTRYCRNVLGSVVHRTGCKVPGKRIPWNWAQIFVNDADMLAGIPTWVKPCRKCFGEPAA